MAEMAIAKEGKRKRTGDLARNLRAGYAIRHASRFTIDSEEQLNRGMAIAGEEGEKERFGSQSTGWNSDWRTCRSAIDSRGAVNPEIAIAKERERGKDKAILSQGRWRQQAEPPSVGGNAGKAENFKGRSGRRTLRL